MTPKDDGRSRIERLIASAGDIAGTAFGAIVGVSTGDPSLVVAGAVAGSVFSKSVGEMATRVLSQRQEKRVAIVVVEAFAAVRAKEALGQTMRDDGFFDGERSDGDEFIEGALRAAMDSFEERKLPYLANLLANVCFDAGIDVATANAALRLADQLSWMELQMLGLFWAAESAGKYTLPEVEKWNLVANWFDATVNQTYIDLNDTHRLVVHKEERADHEELARFDLNLSAVVVTNLGRLVAGLMELQEIPQTDIAPIYEALIRQPEGSDNDATGEMAG